MDKGVYELRRDYWRQIIRECNARTPGMTKRAWFKEHNINPKSFYYWQKQFRSEAVATVRYDSEIQETSVATPVTEADFFDITPAVQSPVKKTDDRMMFSEHLATMSEPELMIRVSDYCIFINSTIREETLETVLKVLRHA